MTDETTPAMIAEAVLCVKGLSSKVSLSTEERTFVNEQAARISEEMMQAWASTRYKGRKKIRPCCVGLALALAMDVAHKMSLPGEKLAK
jgi:hypothetical protein